jgi:opacity protein-like surface antigen
MLKKAAVVGLTGLMLGVSPAAADSMSNGTTVALTMLGGGGLLSIGCMATAFLTRDDEDTEEGYDRRGFYLGLSASYARENFNDSDVDDLREKTGTIKVLSLENDDDDVFGVMGRGGYRCHPYVSTELQFEWLDEFEGSGMMSDDGGPPESFRSKLEPFVMTANVKGHLLTGRFQPFGLLGVGFMRLEAKGRAASFRETNVDVAMRFGGGLEFYATENVVVSAEASYLMPTGELNGLDYYSIGLGLQYRF